MALTPASKASSIHCRYVRFMIKSEDAYIFTFHKYPKGQELWSVVSALNEYLKRTETWRTNGHKFQSLLSYIKPHVEVHNSTVSRWIKEILKETGVDVNVFKGHSTRSACTSKTYLSGIYLVSLPGRNSIMSKCFQKSNFFRKGY